MGIGSVILSGFKKTLKIGIGVALTVAVFFGVGWLTDWNATKNIRVPDDPKIRPYANLSNRPAQVPNAPGPATGQYSVFETLKDAPVTPPQSPSVPPAQQPVPPAAAPTDPGAGTQRPPVNAQTAPDAGNGRARQEPAATSSVTYTIQLGSFQNAEVAQAFTETLSAKGYPVHMLKTDIPGKGTVYRVRVGKYATMEDAQAMAVELEKKENVSAFITSR